jgi:hypothetical protein
MIERKKIYKPNIMAKIYKSPETIKSPTVYSNNPEYKIQYENYISELKAFLLKRKKGKNVGEIISFHVADGSADYMVANTKPVELVRLATSDYASETAELMTAKAIQERVNWNKK